MTPTAKIEAGQRWVRGEWEWQIDDLDCQPGEWKAGVSERIAGLESELAAKAAEGATGPVTGEILKTVLCNLLGWPAASDKRLREVADDINAALPKPQGVTTAQMQAAVDLLTFWPSRAEKWKVVGPLVGLLNVDGPKPQGRLSVEEVGKALEDVEYTPALAYTATLRDALNAALDRKGAASGEDIAFVRQQAVWWMQVLNLCHSLDASAQKVDGRTAIQCVMEFIRAKCGAASGENPLVRPAPPKPPTV